MQRTNPRLNQVFQIGVFVYQALAVAAFIAAILLANWWLKAPFLGAFYEHTLVFNGAGPTEFGDAWDLYNQGVRLGDQLVAVNGVPVRSTLDVQRVLFGQTPGTVPAAQGFVAGETIPVMIRTPGGEQKTLAVTLHGFPSADLMAYLVIPLFLSFIFLLISLWIFGSRRAEIPGRTFAVFTASLAIATGGLFDLFTTHYLTHLWTAAVAIAGGALIELGLSFPREARSIVDRPFLRWTGMVPAALLTLYAYTTLFNFNRPRDYITAWQLIYVFVAISGLFYLGMNVFHSLMAPSPVVKTQARMILGGGAFAFVPRIVWLAGKPFGLMGF